MRKKQKYMIHIKVVQISITSVAAQVISDIN